MFSKYKNTAKINSRRGSDNDATHILDILYTLYPKSITVKKISKELQLSVNKINQSLQQIEKIGVPIVHLRISNIHHIRANTKEPGTIIQEIQKGFTIKDRLLRPSLVGVSKKTSKKEEKTKENEENTDDK